MKVMSVEVSIKYALSFQSKNLKLLLKIIRMKTGMIKSACPFSSKA